MFVIACIGTQIRLVRATKITYLQLWILCFILAYWICSFDNSSFHKITLLRFSHYVFVHISLLYLYCVIFSLCMAMYIVHVVSEENIQKNISYLSKSVKQMNIDIRNAQQDKSATPNDRFLHVMTISFYTFTNVTV